MLPRFHHRVRVRHHLGDHRVHRERHRDDLRVRHQVRRRDRQTLQRLDGRGHQFAVGRVGAHRGLHLDGRERHHGQHQGAVHQAGDDPFPGWS